MHLNLREALGVSRVYHMPVMKSVSNNKVLGKLRGRQGMWGNFQIPGFGVIALLVTHVMHFYDYYQVTVTWIK
jgi:hypothetical protein